MVKTFTFGMIHGVVLLWKMFCRLMRMWLIGWLPSKVSDIIQSHTWHVSQYIHVMFPNLRLLILNLTLSLEDISNKLLWNNSSNGDLSMKTAYEFKRLWINFKSKDGLSSYGVNMCLLLDHLLFGDWCLTMFPLMTC
jgi:hypothetical protein